MLALKLRCCDIDEPRDEKLLLVGFFCGLGYGISLSLKDNQLPRGTDKKIAATLQERFQSRHVPQVLFNQRSMSHNLDVQIELTSSRTLSTSPNH